MMLQKKQINLAENIFLFPHNLDQTKLEKILFKLSGKSIDYADLYFQAIHKESWYLEDNLVKSGSYSVAKGVGIRAVNYDKTGFAFSESLRMSSLEAAANAAKNVIAMGSSNQSYNNTSRVKIALDKEVVDHKFNNHFYDSESPLTSMDDQKKVHLLQTINKLAREMDHRVHQVTASLAGVHEIVLILATDGTYVADLRPLIRLSINVIAKQGTRLEQGNAGGGGRLSSYTAFTSDNFKLTYEYTKKAVNLAINNLSSIPSPAGKMPVILGPGWPGILLHEAVGHGLEGDAIRKGSSAFMNKLGEKVASDLCTIVDNGSIPFKRGSLAVDDEGTVTQNTILIEKGILKNYLQDKLNAKIMGQQSTGNGRRQSYAYVPIPRMTNTYMLSGNNSVSDLIKSINEGIYAVNFSGGQVDVTSGKFVFEASEAYLIENGTIKAPIKGATIIGDGLEVLKKIEMVGNDLELDPGIGTCGKDSQTVPVSVGQPSLLINELTVGGTKC
jgi:TldD protein